MKRLLREPLVHFVVLGAAIFGLDALIGRKSDGAPGSRIVVTAVHLQPLITGFTRTWQRPPSAAELDGLVDDLIRDEVLSREAAAMGLDKDDSIVRRRLRQKMDFVLEDASALATPADTDLSAFRESHASLFREEPRTAFDQVYLSRERRGEKLKTDAAALLSTLKGGAAPDALGDPSVLPVQLEATTTGEIGRLFGTPFAQRLAELETGAWGGPLESPYGLHLVLIKDRSGGRLPPLAEIRDAVAREWSTAKRRELSDAAYRKLREKYVIVIEPAGAVKP